MGRLVHFLNDMMACQIIIIRVMLYIADEVTVEIELPSHLLLN